MKVFIKFFLFFIILIASILQFSCFSEFQEPVMPEWDVSLTLPLIKDYTLGELTDKIEDSKFYYDATRDSVIVYQSTQSISPISINNPDYIELNSSSMHGRICISDIDFKLKENFSFENTITDYFPALPQNSAVIVPAISGINSEKYLSLNSFNQISVDSADIRIEITNNFPVDITINNMVLSNNQSSNKSEIIRKSDISINKGSTINLSEKITKKDLFNLLKLGITISTPGSGSNMVTINPYNLLRIAFYTENIKISYADASFDEQSYNFSLTSKLSNMGNNIQLNQAKIKNGILGVNLKNYSNLNGRLRAQLPEFTYNSSAFSTGDLNVYAKGETSKNYYISGFTLKPKNNSDIDINNFFTANSTYNQFVRLYGTDSITYSLELKNIELESFSGSLSGDIKQSFTLPKADVDKYFNGNVILQNVSAALYVNNGSGLPFLMNNNIVSGYNKKSRKTEAITIDNASINPGTKTKIPINEVEFTAFINKFALNNSFPDVFNFNTKINISTYNQNYIFSAKDTISGYIDLKIPLHFSITNLTYKDSTELNFTDSDKKELNKVNFGRLTIKAYNNIPLDGRLKIIFTNTKNGYSLLLPKNPSSANGYWLASSEKNSSGYSTKEVISIITEELNKDDIVFLSNSDKCIFEVTMNTTSGTPSYLKRDDKIKLNILSEFGYRVKSE